MKNNTVGFRLLSSLVAVAIFAAACSSTTQIRSVPDGAKVYIDGEYKGVTPYSYSDTKTVGSTVNVRLSKDGYSDYTANFGRNEEFDAGACAGGVFVLVPFLWIMKYKSEHMYELSAANGTSASEPAPKKAKPAKKAAPADDKKSE